MPMISNLANIIIIVSETLLPLIFLRVIRTDELEQRKAYWNKVIDHLVSYFKHMLRHYAASIILKIINFIFLTISSNSPVRLFKLQIFTLSIH